MITAQQWALPRSSEALINMPSLAQAVKRMQAQPGSRLLIHYPGGDEGTLWVSELKSWLVALGIPSTRIELVPGSSRQTVIEIEVVAGGENMAMKQHNNKPASVLNEVKP